MGRASIRQIRLRGRWVSKRYATLPPTVRTVVDVVGEKLEKRVTLSQLSNVVSRSPSSVVAMFSRATGLTVHEYQVFLRMTRAAQLLDEGGKIESVASSVGYRSKKNFYLQFHAWFGMSPGEFRSRVKSAEDSHLPMDAAERSR
jgi:AraC family transcriptional regulator